MRFGSLTKECAVKIPSANKALTLPAGTWTEGVPAEQINTGEWRFVANVNGLWFQVYSSEQPDIELEPPGATLYDLTRVQP